MHIQAARKKLGVLLVTNLGEYICTLDLSDKYISIWMMMLTVFC